MVSLLLFACVKFFDLDILRSTLGHKISGRRHWRLNEEGYCDSGSIVVGVKINLGGSKYVCAIVLIVINSRRLLAREKGQGMG